MSTTAIHRYTVEVCFFDNPNIVRDGFADYDAAVNHFTDWCSAYQHCPSDQCGDVHWVVLHDSFGRVMRKFGAA
jgi:hypothetical protein